MSRRYSLDSEQIAAVAAAADVCERSVRRYLGGASMHASSMRRIERALRAAGLDAHVRAVQGTEAA
jgi:hypothetical protein